MQLMFGRFNGKGKDLMVSSENANEQENLNEKQKLVVKGVQKFLWNFFICNVNCLYGLHQSLTAVTGMRA